MSFLSRGRRPSAALALGGLAGLWVTHGCVATELADGQFLCEPGGPRDACPPGQQCGADGICRSSGAQPPTGGHGPEGGGGSGGEGATAGAGGCVPLGCADLYPSCGAALVEPCGGEPLDCSLACPEPETCGGAGTADECGCAPVPSTETRTARAATNEVSGSFDAVWRPGTGNGTLAEAAASSDNVRVITDVPLDEERYSDYLDLRDFGFTLPDDATITGIVVQIERSVSWPDAIHPDVQDSLVRLASAEGNSPENKASTSAWPGTDTVRAYGNEFTTWGQAWSPALVNDPLFGVRIRVRALSADGGDGRATPRIDAVTIDVHYEQPCG